MTILILNRGAFSFDYNEWLPDNIKKETILVSSKPRSLIGFKKVVYVDSIGDSEFQTTLLNIVREYDVRQIFAHSEDDFKLVDSLRKSLNLIDKHLPDLYRFKNKLQMKSLLKGLDVPMADHIKAENVIDIHGYVESNGGYPLVIKPIDGTGSVGVSILRTDEDLSKWCQAPLEFPVIVESFVDKKLFHADGIIVNGQIQFLSIGKYLSQDSGGAHSMLMDGALCSAILSRKESDAAEEIYLLAEHHLQKFANYARNHLLPFHFEFFYDNGDKDIVACEIAARIGGPRILETNTDLFGVNLHKIWLSEFFGIPWEIPTEVSPSSSGGWVLYNPVGKRLIRGPSECNLDAIASTSFKFESGQRLDQVSNSAEYALGVSFRAKTSEEALQIAGEILEWSAENFVVAKS